MFHETDTYLGDAESSRTDPGRRDLVSVVIPAYNRATLLEDAIRSVLAQTYQELEIVVVDDGSQDDTPALLETLAQADPRITYVRHPANRGAQAARNTGIRNSKGCWIAFLDSDDRWLPRSLQLRLGAASKTGRKVIHSECLVTTMGAGPRPYGIPPTAGSAYRTLLQKPALMFPSLFVSREALDRIGYLDETVRAYQEWDTGIRLAKYFLFEFLTEPTFIYDCRHSDSISKDFLKSAAGYEQVFTKHRWQILRHLGPRALARHCHTAARMYEMGQDDQSARRCRRQALIWWPFQPRTILNRIKRVAYPERG